MHSKKPFLLSFIVLARFSSKRTLAFLVLSQHAFTLSIILPTVQTASLHLHSDFSFILFIHRASRIGIQTLQRRNGVRRWPWRRVRGNTMVASTTVVICLVYFPIDTLLSWTPLRDKFCLKSFWLNWLTYSERFSYFFKTGVFHPSLTGCRGHRLSCCYRRQNLHNGTNYIVRN